MLEKNYNKFLIYKDSSHLQIIKMFTVQFECNFDSRRQAKIRLNLLAFMDHINRSEELVDRIAIWLSYYFTVRRKQYRRNICRYYVKTSGTV